MLDNVLELMEKGSVHVFIDENHEMEFFMVDNGVNTIGIITRDTDNGETIIYCVKGVEVYDMMHESWETINNAMDKVDPNIDYGNGIVS